MSERPCDSEAECDLERHERAARQIGGCPLPDAPYETIWATVLLGSAVSLATAVIVLTLLFLFAP